MPTRQSEIRKDYFLNRQVIITPSRALRPRDIKEETIIKRTGDCYFCPDKIAVRTEKNKDYVKDKITGKKNWDVLSIQNIFPAVTPDNKKAYGHQEVIIETPDHDNDLSDLSEGHVIKILEMYARRTRALAEDKNINYILCFKNQGSKAGASIVHSHSQVFATQTIPADIEEEYLAVKKYKLDKKSCAYCDIMKKEMTGPRKIFEDNRIAVFTPYASQYHYEAWIFAKRHVDNIADMKTAELKSLARALKLVVSKLDALGLSFNYFMHQVIPNTNQHFYIKVQPRDSVWAGVEIGSGLVINSISPETAAKYYRG